MKRKVNKNTVLFFYALMKSAIRQTPVPELPEDVSWTEIFFYAKHNSVAGLLYYGARNCPNSMPSDLDQEWKKQLYNTVYYNLAMTSYREELFQEMEMLGIDYIPMKGILVQESYPFKGMRSMSDNDILYRFENDEERIRSGKSASRLKLLSRNPQNQVEFPGGPVDLIRKDDFVLFEMHRDFLGADQPQYAYYRKIWDYAQQVGESHHYRLTDTEHFLLMLVHSFKHYSHNGCGPKELADYYVVKQDPFQHLDWHEIQLKADSLGITEYIDLLERLTQVIFEGRKGTVEDWNELTKWMLSGTYGSEEQGIENSLNTFKESGKNLQQAKRQYFLQRLFPPEEFLKDQFPFFYRHRNLRVFLLFYRVYRGLRYSRKRIFKELKNVVKAESEVQPDE